MSAKSMSSYISTSGSAATRSIEKLSFPFTVRPQALSIYLRFQERGIAANSTSLYLCSVGRDTSTAFRTLFILGDGSGNYRMRLDSFSSVTSTLSAGPAYGDIVELRGILSATGTVRLHQSINGAAETSATESSGAELPSVWTHLEFWLNGSSFDGSVGYAAFLNAVLVRGNLSLGSLRRIAGV